MTVHARTVDHHPDGTAYQRFNKKAAIWLTGHVGTMTCCWLFCLWSLLSLPAVLSMFHLFQGVFPSWLVRASVIALVAWFAQTFVQLVLLPALMVGQNLQNEAGDARSAKTFEDVERIIDSLRLDTEGGLKTVYDAVQSLKEQPKAAVRRRREP